MKVGLLFVNSGYYARPDLFGHLAVTAERVGVESLWSVEHVVIPHNYESKYPYSKTGRIPGEENSDIPDPLIPLAYAAALTKKVRLATGILILPQRHPLYTAKEVATVDVLSKGRMILGIGSGWLKEEFDALGLDFGKRGRMTDEAIQAMRAVWRESPASFHGEMYHFHDVMSFPKPVQAGGVPIHIGGHSPAAARRAGRYGDGFFPAIGEIDKLKELFAMMGEAAAKAGRKASEIELSCMGRASLDAFKAFEDLGVSRVVVPTPGRDAEGVTRGLEKIGNEVIAKL